MEKLITFTVQNLDIEMLNKKTAIEAIFYIDFLLSKEKNHLEVQRFIKLKSQVKNRLDNLNNKKNSG